MGFFFIYFIVLYVVILEVLLRLFPRVVDLILIWFCHFFMLPHVCVF